MMARKSSEGSSNLRRGGRYIMVAAEIVGHIKHLTEALAYRVKARRSLSAAVL